MKVTASLYEKCKKYHVSLSWMKDGKRNRKSIALGLEVRGNKRIAQKRMEEIRCAYEKQLSESKDEILFSDYLIEWLEQIRSSIAETTYIEYRAQIQNRIIPWFAKQKIILTDLKAHHIQDFYQYKLDHDGVSANTIHRYHANIRKALQDAFKLDRIIENPADKVNLPKIKKYKANFLNGDELNHVLQATKGTIIETPVFLTVWYGLRRGEVLGLRWSDVDFDAKTITVNGSIADRGELSKKNNLKYKEPKTESSHRTFPLIPDVERYLIQLKEQQDENRMLCGASYHKEWNEYICVNTNGELILPDNLTHSFPRICEQYGIRRIRFHDLRHSCASLLLAKGASMKEIQNWLGHANFNITADTYAHVAVESKNRLATSLTEVFK